MFWFFVLFFAGASGERTIDIKQQSVWGTRTAASWREDTENNRKVVFELDAKWSKYILPKGFVAVDGCSLTVGETSPGRFNVWLIPETIRQTVFDGKDVGSTVNIEIESQTQTIVDTIERVLAEKGL